MPSLKKNFHKKRWKKTFISDAGLIMTQNLNRLVIALSSLSCIFIQLFWQKHSNLGPPVPLAIFKVNDSKVDFVYSKAFIQLHIVASTMEVVFDFVIGNTYRIKRERGSTALYTVSTACTVYTAFTFALLTLHFLHCLHYFHY